MPKIILHKELFDFDSEIRRDHPIICGVDEAGRGPLAGDVYAAAVVFSEGVEIEYLNDSKKISEKRRELLYDVIIEKADAYCSCNCFGRGDRLDEYSPGYHACHEKSC